MSDRDSDSDSEEDPDDVIPFLEDAGGKRVRPLPPVERKDAGRQLLIMDIEVHWLKNSAVCQICVASLDLTVLFNRYVYWKPLHRDWMDLLTIMAWSSIRGMIRRDRRHSTGCCSISTSRFQRTASSYSKANSDESAIASHLKVLYDEGDRQTANASRRSRACAQARTFAICRSTRCGLRCWLIYRHASRRQ